MSDEWQTSLWGRGTVQEEVAVQEVVAAPERRGCVLKLGEVAG